VRKLLWAAVLLGTLVLAGLQLLKYLAGRISWETAVRLEGAAWLGPTSSRFNVGVMGDAQKGLANLSNITRALLKERAQYLLQTGDLVSTNDNGHYQLAELYLVRGGTDRWPIVVPGNHDIKGGTDEFEFNCGPLERSFTMNDVAFVTLNNASGKPPDLKHVEARIAAAGPHKSLVLAMHVPPFDLQGTPRPEYEVFLSWLEKSKVAYLLCGHVHAYLKKKVGETTVIINGVGGDYDSWQMNQKVYGTILEIDGATITDRRIEIEPVHEVWENVEHLAAGHVGEAYRQHPVLCWGATLLLAAGVGWGWVRLVRRPKNISTP
jgi:predicted phosphodiesterase